MFRSIRERNLLKFGSLRVIFLALKVENKNFVSYLKTDFENSRKFRSRVAASVEYFSHSHLPIATPMVLGSIPG
jgi:hypothetical protein